MSILAAVVALSALDPATGLRADERPEWQALGPRSGPVQSVAAGTFFYAGTKGTGLFREGGINQWVNLGNGLSDSCIQALAVEVGHDTDTVYAGTDDGVFKSINSGETWVRADQGLAERTVLCLAIDPETGMVLWANDEAGGIEMDQPHPTARAKSGVSAQGYLVASGDHL